MTSFTSPTGGVKHYAFDGDGRLISERDSVGGGVNLKREVLESNIVTGGTIAQGSVNTLERLATCSSNYVTSYCITSDHLDSVRAVVNSTNLPR